MSRKQKRVLVRILAAAALTVLAWLLPLKGIPRLAAFLVPYLVIGYDVLWKAVRNIAHGQVFDESFLMAVATIGAFAVGEYPEAAAVMLFYQVGELFQSIAVGRSRRSIAALMDIRPDTACVVRDGTETVVSPEEVAVGETIVVRPGEKIPLDGRILEGRTAVDAAALTGESVPEEKAPGQKVVSGTVNLSGVIRVRTESAFGESTVSKILELVENASSRKAKAENFITRFARWYTPCVVGGAVLLAVLPPLLLGGGWAEWIHRALIFLVVSCPCALVCSVPLTFFGGIGGASRSGILFKGAGGMEMLEKTDTVVFDKTGTLTKGRFAVTAVRPAEGITSDALLQLAAAVERYSTHPIAEAVREAAAGNTGDAGALRTENTEELAGLGLKAQIGNDTIYAGNKRLMERIGLTCEAPDGAGTVVHLARVSAGNAAYLGSITAADACKDGAREALDALKGLGVRRTVMLTGDRKPSAEAVGRALGIDEIHAELLPGDKVDRVEAILREGRRTAFVGDGINDAPVLARADVGIAMGAMGSDAAIESADVVLMDDRLDRLPAAVRIARRTLRIVRENIVFALGVKALILLLGALGIADMWMAVFGDVGVLILAVLNALRAMKREK